MSFDQVLHSERPESQRGDMQSGVMIGLYPALVTDIRDPLNLGRVRCRCPLIDPNRDVPSGRDGWIPVKEQWSNNDRPGGSHRNLQPGTQVYIQSVMGSPREWVVDSCVNSIPDPPHPDVNRANGTYGSASANGVINASDDANLRRIESFPHGVNDLVSSTGDRTIQTENARTQLTQAGDVRIENENAYSNVTADGQVVSQSAGGATSTLNVDGTAQISTAFASALNLIEMQTLLSGPLNSISAAIKTIDKELSGYLGEAEQLLGSLKNAVEGLNLPLGEDQLLGVINQADGALQELGGMVDQNLDKGLEAIKKLQSATPADIGRLLMPELETIQPIAGFIEPVAQLLDSGQLSIPEILRAAGDLLPPSLAGIDLSSAQEILTNLDHDPQLQLEALIDIVLPDGIESIGSLVGLDIAGQIGPIQSVIAEAQAAIAASRQSNSGDKDKSGENGTNSSAEEGQPEPLNLTPYVEQLGNLLPEDLREAVPLEAILGALQGGAFDLGLETLLGHLQQELVTRAGSLLEKAMPLLEGIKPVQSLIEQLATQGPMEAVESAISSIGELPDFAGVLQEGLDLQGVLKEAVGPLVDQLPDVLNEALGGLEHLTDSIPAAEAGAFVQLNEIVGRMTDPSHTNSIYTNQAGVGMQTPWGGLSFSEIGGAFAGAALSLLGEKAGFLMDRTGAASLVSGAGAGENGGYAQESARVQVQGNTISIDSFLGGHSIRVDDNDVHINGVSFTSLLERIEALESSPGGGGGVLGL